MAEKFMQNNMSEMVEQALWAEMHDFSTLSVNTVGNMMEVRVEPGGRIYNYPLHRSVFQDGVASISTELVILIDQLNLHVDRLEAVRGNLEEWREHIPDIARKDLLRQFRDPAGDMLGGMDADVVEMVCSKYWTIDLLGRDYEDDL
jgi:hypothetical protein